MSRFTNAVILILTLAMPGVVQAQTCTPPVIIQVGGTNPVCAGQPVMLDAGSGWSTYQWSPGGAATRMISDTPSATMSYTVTTTDANGCTVTSQPLTVVVNSAPGAPSIHLSDTAICATGASSASVDGPSGNGSWSSIQWTLEHATSSNLTSSNVSYVADGSGQPVTLHVTVQDASSCSADASATVPIRTITPPALHLYDPAICANGSSFASVDSPSEQYNSWQQVTWSVDHATITYGQGGPSISFTADGSGQAVVIRVHVKDNYGCEADVTGTVGIRTITPPTIRLYEPSMCANGSTFASVDAPTEQYNSWQGVTWSIDHATITYGQGGSSISFTADGSGQPVVIHVHVRDNYACEADATTTMAIRTITAPTIRLYEPSMCANGSTFASVDNPSDQSNSWQGVTWSVDHATITYGQGGPSISFTADGSGQAVVIHVHVRDNYACEADATTTMAIRTITPPTIRLYQPSMCANGSTFATVDNPSDQSNSWQGVTWSVDHATITYGQGGSSISFAADGSGQTVVIHVHVRDNYACEADATTTMAIRTIPPPQIHTYPSPLCPGSYGYASIDPPAGDYWQSVTWSIQNGSIQYGQGGSYIFFQPDGTGVAVVLHAEVRDSYTCVASAEVTIPVVGDVLAIQLGNSTLSRGVPATATIPSTFASQSWSVDHATIDSDPSQPSISFTPDGTGAVTLSVSATTAAGCWQGTSQTVTLDNAVLMIEGPVEYCTTTDHNADIYPSAGATNIQWSITNGTITSGATLPNITFQPAGGADVTLTATATMADGTPRTATRVVRFHQPVLDLDIPATYCPGSQLIVRLRNTQDFIQGGGFDATNALTDWVYGNFESRFDTSPSYTGPIVVTGHFYTADGCVITGSATVNPVDSVHPTITLANPAICPGSLDLATVGNASQFSHWSWTISNGHFSGQNVDPTGLSVGFVGNSSTPVHLTLTAYPADGSCPSTSSVDVPISTESASISTSGSLCGPNGVILTATPGASYLWSPGGQTTQSITVTQANGYSVQVTTAGGCNLFASINVPLPVVPVPPISASGPTFFCGGGSVTLTAPGGYSYSWSTGATTQSIVVTDSGNYAVTVFDANGCSATSIVVPVTVTDPPPLDVVTPTSTTICPGASSTLIAPSGYTYLWSTGATTRTITVSTAGTYSVTITNAGNCSRTLAPVTITSSTPTASITAGGPTSLCAGGSVTLTANSGSTYSWSNGAITRSITVAAAGTYTVSVVNANGCLATSSPVTVSVDTPSAAITASGSTTLCAGGSVTLTASSGASWLWSNGATTQAITVSAAGTYSVTVTDGAGCSAIASQAVSADTFTATVSPLSVQMCDTSGGYFLTASPAASWLWSTGETTQQILVHTAGVYTVTATNANGCSATSAGVPVTVLPAPHVTATISNASVCGGQEVTITGTVTGGSGVYTRYELFDNYYVGVMATSTTSPVFTVPVNGNDQYRIVAYDANGCSSSFSNTVSVTAATPPAHSFGVDISTYLRYPTCPDAGATVMVNFPGDYASFLWSTGATTSSITVHTPGHYTVTATTAGGCVYTGSRDVEFLPPAQKPVITPSGPTTLCQSESVTLTSTPAVSYYWSNGATTQAITITAPGNEVGSTPYSVTAVDANGCAATSDPVTVTIHQRPVPIAYATLDSICGTTSATLTEFDQDFQRSTVGDTYLWSNGVTTKSMVVNTPGTYHVTVTTAQGCSNVSNDVPVVFNAPLVVTAVAQTPATICAGSSVTLTAQFSGGVGPYVYRWSTNDSGVNLSAVTSQTITVTPTMSSWYQAQVADSNNCSTYSAHLDVVVNARPVPTVTPSGPTTFCAGGSVTLTASGGSSYLWSTGATTSSIVANTTGSYSVTVTNANGCSATSSPTVVTVNASPAASITAGGPTTFCAGGTVTLTASSGASYLWSNGATTQSITASTSGSYSVTVTNANGCRTTSSPTVVTANANPTASITAGGPTTFCAGGSVTLTASSGASYLWSTGATTQAITANASGSYSVTVTDVNGCSATSSPTVVTANANPTASITAGGPTTFCAGGSVMLTASSGASYLWSTGATTQAITASTGGNYSVTVTNANGCSATSSPTVVTANANPTASITAGGPTTFCAGGSVTLTASSGASYLWSNGATTQAIAASASGSYSVTVTNANGCSAMSSPTVVTANANPTASITAGGPTTFCASGSVTLTASSGSSYLWSTGATTQAIAASASGSYSVTVTNANGCSATSSPTVVTANANPTASITAGGPTTFCAGASVTLTASSGASYLWSTGATTQSITSSTSGSYSVTVTNANGCSATSSPTVVTANANPTASITAGGPTTFCAGGSVTLTVSSGASYLWSTGATTQAITANASGNYSVTVTDSNGCSATSAPTTVTVNANPIATITAGGPTTFCAGGSVTLTASSGASYLWSTGATTQSITASASGNYSVTVTNANGCSATSASTAVTVNANPTATITAGGPTTFCTGGSVTLTASSGSSYLWSTGATTSSITVSAGGNYTVNVTNANGCSATSAPASVTVRPNPSATVSGGGAICAGSSATITATLTGTAPWNVTWSDNVTQPVSSGTTATRSVSPSSSTTYTVTSVSDASGCSIAGSGSAAVTVKTPTATVSGNATLCPGASATITAALTGTAPWSVKWSDNTTQTINTGTTATRTVNPSVTTTYTVTSVTDASGCPAVAGSGSATITRNVAASITTQPANKSTTVNTNVTITVVAAGSSPIFYQWFQSNGTIVTGATSSSYTTSFPAKGNYQFYVEVWNSCNTTHVKSHNVTVTVN